MIKTKYIRGITFCVAISASGVSWGAPDFSNPFQLDTQLAAATPTKPMAKISPLPSGLGASAMAPEEQVPAASAGEVEPFDVPGLTDIGNFQASEIEIVSVEEINAIDPVIRRGEAPVKQRSAAPARKRPSR